MNLIAHYFYRPTYGFAYWATYPKIQTPVDLPILGGHEPGLSLSLATVMPPTFSSLVWVVPPLSLPPIHPCTNHHLSPQKEEEVQRRREEEEHLHLRKGTIIKRDYGPWIDCPSLVKY